MSKLRLEGKVAIITGASGGIGEAAARLFAQHGARIVIADVKDDLGSAVAESIGSDICKYKHCDVTDELQVSGLVDYAVSTFGKLDIMYSNAGIMGKPASMLEVSLEELENVLAVNVKGSFACLKHASRVMVSSGTKGSIICTASLAATHGGMGPHGYTASKHAVVGLVKSAAGEFGNYGIRVNSVSPAGVVTPMALQFSGVSESMAEMVCKKMSNMKDVTLKVNDVAQAALFLASDESSYVSGHNLVLDGGMTVLGPKPPEINV
ncbi:hypothetical protein LUZ60_015951 [Juncus effusus]|nr:hypothetical protein LUZ60_015951 [Juncus effusus]